MSTLAQRVSPLVQCVYAAVLLAGIACTTSNRPDIDVERRRPSYDDLLNEAKNDYTYALAGNTVSGDAAAIGKIGGVTGVTMTAWSATRKSEATEHTRKVVARFDLAGGDYRRLGMHKGINYVFLEANNSTGPGAILTKAYYVVSEANKAVRYIVVDKRLNLLPNHRYSGPVAITADPEQSYVFAACVEGTFCTGGHCSLTDAGDLY